MTVFQTVIRISFCESDGVSNYLWIFYELDFREKHIAFLSQTSTKRQKPEFLASFSNCPGKLEIWHLKNYTLRWKNIEIQSTMNTVTQISLAGLHLLPFYTNFSRETFTIRDKICCFKSWFGQCLSNPSVNKNNQLSWSFQHIFQKSYTLLLKIGKTEPKVQVTIRFIYEYCPDYWSNSRKLVLLLYICDDRKNWNDEGSRNLDRSKVSTIFETEKLNRSKQR